MGMSRSLVVGLAISLLPAGALASGWSARAGSVDTTHRRVHGIITAVDGNDLTIVPISTRPEMTGRVDPKRTHIEVDGKPAHASDLVTLNASAELGLDEVWVSIRASTR
jgi:hypothetical protein